MRAPTASARFLLLLGASLAALACPAAADGPRGGAVVRGEASISKGAHRKLIRQRSNRAVIEWKRFDLGRGHRVVFGQPGKASATLNRVKSANRSVIAGALRAPGTVILQNRAGVIFTESARIDAGGMVAASQEVDAARFQRDGRLVIGGAAEPGAQIVNAGRITVRDAGLVALVGPDIENSGAIVARRGTVALTSGARTTIDFAGDGMVRLAVTGDAPGATGAANHGEIDVGDGRVLLSAGAAAGALDAAINTDGVIRAVSATGDGGRVELVGRGAGQVRIGGAIDVSGARRGGALTATGAEIDVAASARIDASGGFDGGSVRLGGDRHGMGPLRRADHLGFAAGAVINAEGNAGRGGEVVLWSDGATRFDGAISARGPIAGGFVETSGREALDVGASASVAVGLGGVWLLDPRDVEIGNAGMFPAPPGITRPPVGAGAFTINRNAIASTLNAGGDVTISTVQPGATMAGDITITAPLTWNGAGALRLEAERDINISANVTVGDGDFTAVAARDIRNGGAISAPRDGGVAFDAGRSVVVNQNIRATGSGGIALQAGTGSVLLTELRAGNLIVSTDGGALSLRARDGAVELSRIEPVAGSNIQVFSDSGSVDLSAGTRILLEGGAQGGRWVRLGQVGSSADVTLTAPRVKLRGGEVGNTFAEVVSGPGGSIAIHASERIWVHNGAGDQARIQTTGGSPLTLLGETQLWDGPVRAGNGARNGGEVVIAGDIAARFQPQFSLAPDAGFTFLPAAPGGAASRYVSSQPFVVNASGSGAIEIDAPIAAEQVTLESEERVGLGPRGLLTGAEAGDAVVVAAGRRFRNDSAAGAGALAASDPDARWLLYLDAFAGLTGPVPAPHGFDLYGRSYDAAPPSTLGFAGDRIVYAERPTLTITGETLAKTYGVAANPGFTVAGLRPGDSLATALDAGPSVVSGGAATDAGAGTYATIATASASEQGYLLALDNGVLTVNPAPLTVRADDARRSYGAENPALTAAITGFVLGEDPSDLDGVLSVATDAGPAGDAGRYAITAAGLTSGNYDIAYEDGALTIDPTRLTIRADDARRAYGAAAPDLTATATGFVLGQDLSDLDGALTLVASADQASDVGSYAIIASGLASGNYDLAYEDGALTIDPARLVVTPGGDRTYGSAAAAFDTAFGGFVLGQDVSDLGGALIYATPATASSDAGTYPLTASGLASSNYDISYAEGALTIDPARLTIRADDARRGYGAANPTLTASADGFVLGQDFGDLDGALALATDGAQGSDVGSYAIRASGLASGNYDIAYETGALTIDPARLTIRADDKSRTYGAAHPRLTASAGGFVLGQNLSDLDGSLSLVTDGAPNSDVGSHAIIASGLTSGNYDIAYETGAMTIDPARLTISGDDKSRTYGAANPKLTASADGFVLGQDLDDLGGSLTLSTGGARNSDVGSYAISASGLTSGNYAIVYQEGALTINPARLVVTPEGARTYGGATADFDAVIDGFVLGEDVSDLGGALEYATPATTRSDAGSYPLTASGLTNANYDIRYSEGALTIDPARLTIRADDKSRTYGGANPRLTASATGFVLGQQLDDLGGSLVLATDVRRASDVGSHAITASGLTSGNYDIAYEDGTLAVERARLTVTPRGTRTYGSAATDFDAAITGFALGQDVSDLDGALVYATPATARSDAGAYLLTASGLRSGNYAIRYSDGALTISPTHLTVRINDAERAAGRPNPALSARYDGFVLGQDAGDLGRALELTTAATRGSPPGRYAITGAGLASGNYAIAYENGLLTVRPANQEPPSPEPGPEIASLDQSIEIYDRGAPPYTPGDSAFRTTNAEAATSIDSTFALTYSLGEIAQLAPPAAADTGGFTPASGGAGGLVPAAGGAGDAPTGACSGPIALMPTDGTCVLRSAPESFWTTAFPGAAR